MMYPLLSTFQETGFMGWVQLAFFFAAGLWALVCAVLLGIRWRVPPVVAVAPLVVVPSLVALGSSLAASTVTGAVALLEPAQRAAMIAAGIAESLAQGWLGLLALPVALVLAIGGLAAGVRAPRSWGVPALVFASAGLAALLPAAGLLFDASLPSVLARVLLYGMAVLPLALATASPHPKGNGPEGGVVAAAAWVSLVGACELATLTSTWSRGFGALGMVDPEHRADIVRVLVEEVDGLATLGWVTFAVAAVPLLVAALRSGPEPSVEEIMNGEASPSPWRALARLLALAVWPAWGIALLSIDASETLETILKLGVG